MDGLLIYGKWRMNVRNLGENGIYTKFGSCECPIPIEINFRKKFRRVVGRLLSLAKSCRSLI